MATFDVAHIRQQGVDLIIIPLTSSFGHKTSNEQKSIVVALQAASRSAGLAGTVVPVWDAGFGRMAFLAPRPWHSFFASINLMFVSSNINRQLICN